ncbi:hypothetical protein C1752_04348 [Acaryochloris thomasi RCC1774]|uniref:SAM-dependent methyltransferase n=1 Tax=Acaryochloris thomasi RCC1774 TaxID=1764569 RepID=A0A2W1JDY8_9CYAN|nr:DUF938 domain-containing protein [Acaryochloris thomasi]PZD71946.1 hypothetical protein C1752_04348 [Acaryochloris thomasi RCC1774]
MAIDARQYAPATQRNRDVILSILHQVLPTQGTVLEVSSGTGEHAVYFAPRLQPRYWLPSDLNPVAQASIAAWRDHHPTEYLLAPIHLNAEDSSWLVEQEGVYRLVEPIVAIANINMIHISPWSACLGLLAGAGRILPPGGILYIYGPYKQNGAHTAESNAVFDQGLRSQNPAWGIRNLEDVIEAAQIQQLKLLKTVSMPANNLSVILQRN